MHRERTVAVVSPRTSICCPVPHVLNGAVNISEPKTKASISAV